MRQLTDDGRMAVGDIANRNGVSFDAAATLLAALDRGNGFQAQFSHPELGGMGQWSQGGMIMVGDMFNNGLKYRVDQLCNELSNLMRSRDIFVPAPLFGGGGYGGSSWWPAEFGQPSSSGGQNDMQYAVFPAMRRLAVRFGDQVRLYDTGQHQIGGVSQQQGGDAHNLTFTSQFGTVRLYDLGLISGGTPASAPAQPVYAPPDPVVTPPPVAPAPIFQAPPYPTPAIEAPPTAAPIFDPAVAPMGVETAFMSQPTQSAEDDIFAKIERLHSLMIKGILSEAEFTKKKQDLLDRL